MTATTKPQTMTFRLGKNMRARIDALAKEWEMSPSELVRHAVNMLLDSKEEK